LVPIKIGTPAGTQVLKKLTGGAQLVPIKIGTLAGMQVLKKNNGGSSVGPDKDRDACRNASIKKN